MYINEKSFESIMEDKYKLRNSIEKFIRLVYELTTDYRLENIYFCGQDMPRWNSVGYPLEKWLADSDVDADTKRQWMLLMRKINLFQADKNYSFLYQDEEIAAGVEAILNESYMISFLTNEKWEKKELYGIFVELNEITGELTESERYVCNLTQKEQIEDCEIASYVVEKESENYDEMWKQRDKWFPNLSFCPSDEKDLKDLEMAYIHQVWKRLKELDEYAKLHGKERFDACLLNHVTPESELTLQMYKKEHTFYDEKGKAYVFNWHSRFTGVEGRIFFWTKYEEDKILIGYVGKKLKNASYPT